MTLNIKHLPTLVALTLATIMPFNCGGGGDKPTGRYDDFRKGVADKSHHKKGYGFND